MRSCTCNLGWLGSGKETALTTVDTTGTLRQVVKWIPDVPGHVNAEGLTLARFRSMLAETIYGLLVLNNNGNLTEEQRLDSWEWAQRLQAMHHSKCAIVSGKP